MFWRASKYEGLGDDGTIRTVNEVGQGVEGANDGHRAIRGEMPKIFTDETLPSHWRLSAADLKVENLSSTWLNDNDKAWREDDLLVIEGNETVDSTGQNSMNR